MNQFADEQNDTQHSDTGKYTIEELLPDLPPLTVEQVITLVVSQIVVKPEQVRIHIANMDRHKALEFAVAPGDYGPVLGGAGRTIGALRTLVKAMLGPNAKKYVYDIELAEDK